MSEDVPDQLSPIGYEEHAYIEPGESCVFCNGLAVECMHGDEGQRIPLCATCLEAWNAGYEIGYRDAVEG